MVHGLETMEKLNEEACEALELTENEWIDTVLAHKYLDGLTVRGFLVDLARSCWNGVGFYDGRLEESEDSWQYDLAVHLMNAGFVAGNQDLTGNRMIPDFNCVENVLDLCFDRLAAG